MKAASITSIAIVLMGMLGCSNVSGAPADAGPTCTATPAGDDAGADASKGDDDQDDGGDGDIDSGASACAPGDTDGINGGCYAFTVTVDDNGFSPIILKAQNNGQVVITVKNAGTKPHDFSVGCMSTANLRGCPAQTCFPAASVIPSIAPGATASASFVTPNPEGIYIFRSDISGDSQLEIDGGVSGIWGQLVIQ